MLFLSATQKERDMRRILDTTIDAIGMMMIFGIGLTAYAVFAN